MYVYRDLQPPPTKTKLHSSTIQRIKSIYLTQAHALRTTIVIPRLLQKEGRRFFHAKGYRLTSWWLNQPIWKICSSNWIISPGRDEHLLHIWNHQLVDIVLFWWEKVASTEKLIEIPGSECDISSCFVLLCSQHFKQCLYQLSILAQPKCNIYQQITKIQKIHLSIVSTT